MGSGIVCKTGRSNGMVGQGDSGATGKRVGLGNWTGHTGTVGLCVGLGGRKTSGVAGQRAVRTGRRSGSRLNGSESTALGLPIRVGLFPAGLARVVPPREIPQSREDELWIYIEKISVEPSYVHNY